MVTLLYTNKNQSILLYKQQVIFFYKYKFDLFIIKSRGIIIVSSIILTIAYFISSTILGKYIQGNKKLKKSNSICLSIGLLLNMYLYLITTIIGINWIFSIVPMLFCTVHYYMFLNKKNHLNNKIDLIKYISIIIIILPNFIQSLYMGLGSYPNHFFSVDSGFHLANVYNFYYETEYPPKSLEVLGQEPFKYHFGIHALSAMISKFTSLPPHTIFLLIIPTIINFLLYIFVKYIKFYSSCFL